MSLHFQQILPSEVKVGQWVKIEFDQFGPAVLLVEEMDPNRIVGFDIIKCEKVSLRLRHDRTVLNAENWPARSYDTPLSESEVKYFVAERKQQLQSRIAEVRKSLQYLEAFAEKYTMETSHLQ